MSPLDRVGPGRLAGSDGRSGNLARLPNRVAHFCVPVGRERERDRSPHNTGEPTINQEIPVAAVCEICNKKPGFGHNVSHSHRRTNRRWDPNIQTVRTPAGGGTTRKMQVCTSCIKAGKVVRG